MYKSSDAGKTWSFVGLRDVGQKFSNNRRTVVITAPEISVPPELATLVEYFDLPLPDRIVAMLINDDHRISDYYSRY
jgi:hypothetical protein